VGKWLTVLAAVMIAPAPVPASGSALTYHAVDLGTLGGRDSEALAVNRYGLVVGQSQVRSGHRHPFLWRAGRMIDLGTLGGPDAVAVDVNSTGQVVGASDTASGARHAFLWSGGRLTDLGGGVPAANTVEAAAISDSGVVTGTGDLASFSPKAFRWRDGRLTWLPGTGTGTGGSTGGTVGLDVDGRGDVLGLVDGRQLVRWRGTSPTVLATVGAMYGAVNARADQFGDVVGYSYTSHVPYVYLWRDGALRTYLNPLTDSAGCTATAINDNREFVGACQSVLDGATHAYLDRDNAVVDLSTRGIAPGSAVTGINNRRQIAGSITLPGGATHAALFQP
jgi:probable HAF family extracellular repeat protein